MATTERPATMVDINRLPLGTIDGLPGGGLRLGALVSNADTARHELVTRRYPLLAAAILAAMRKPPGKLLAGERTRCAGGVRA